MDFKTFIFKKMVISYFIATTCITGAMAVVGMLFEPTVRFGYEAFLSPLLFGAIATLPGLVQYSKKELSLQQTLLRDLIHLILLETLILLVLWANGMVTSGAIAFSLALAILIIDLTVHLVMWINDKKSARELTSGLKKLQGV